MVGCQGEDGADKGLRKGVQPLFEIPEKGFVPDAPGAVVIGLVAVGFPAELLTEAHGFREAREPQRLSLRTMIESAAVSLVLN